MTLLLLQGSAITLLKFPDPCLIFVEPSHPMIDYWQSLMETCYLNVLQTFSDKATFNKLDITLTGRSNK